MRLRVAIAVLLILASRVPAEASDTDQGGDSPRSASLLFGVGPSCGGLGAGAEAYLASSRFSLFGALGYVPSSNGGRGATGIAAAVGARVFTGGHRHRGFAEASLSPLGVEVAPEGSGRTGERILYGPGFSLGYQFVGSNRITFMLSGGIAYAMTGPDNLHGTAGLATVALGYTWRRKGP